MKRNVLIDYKEIHMGNLIKLRVKEKKIALLRICGFIKCTAEEVEKKGQNLGEMNKLLMKKVEELTLYAIENERKDKEKDKLLTSLQEQINLLKQQLTSVQKNAKH